MSAVRRGVKNTFRNSIRTIAIVIILGLSIALALVMLLSMKAVDSRITQVKHDVGNKITVRAAGFRDFQGGGNPLTTANVTAIGKTPHVVTAVPVVTDRLRNENSTNAGGPGGFGGQSTNTNNTTSLTSPISPGALGQRFGNDQNGTTQQTLPANFSLPVTVTGTSHPEDPRALQVDTISLTAGTSFDGSGTALEALVGTDLATKNSLTVGSTFTAWGETITVKGIYKTGDTFADAGVLMPIGTVEKLSGQTGPTAIYVTVDSVDHLNSTVSAISKQLGTSADVAADSSASVATLDSLQNIKTISTYSLVGALVAAGVITFLLMLMIVRERRREIGVLKAIGGSNSKITFQFVAEAVTFTLMAAVAGILVGIILANPVLDVLVKNSSDTTTATATFGGPGQGRGFPGQGQGGAATGGNANGGVTPREWSGAGQLRARLRQDVHERQRDARQPEDGGGLRHRALRNSRRTAGRDGGECAPGLFDQQGASRRSDEERMMLTVTGLSKTFGSGDIEVRAVRDVSFSAADGTFAAILGRSGSGKSTLLGLLGGLDRPDGGKCRGGRRLDHERFRPGAHPVPAWTRRVRVPELPAHPQPRRAGERDDPARVRRSRESGAADPGGGAARPRRDQRRQAAPAPGQALRR